MILKPFKTVVNVKLENTDSLELPKLEKSRTFVIRNWDCFLDSFNFLQPD